MKKLILTGISAVKTEKARKDGKAQRQYFTAYFANPENPLSDLAQRNFFQAHSADGKVAFWKNGMTPELISSFVGKQLSGEIVRAEVEGYMIGDRQATSYTCVVLQNELLASIVGQAGHTLKGTVATAIAAPVGNDIE